MPTLLRNRCVIQCIVGFKCCSFSFYPSEHVPVVLENRKQEPVEKNSRKINFYRYFVIKILVKWLCNFFLHFNNCISNPMALFICNKIRIITCKGSDKDPTDALEKLKLNYHIILIGVCDGQHYKFVVICNLIYVYESERRL